MELKKIGEKTYYIDNATNIGVYKIDDNNVYIIDSGNDKECGKKILKIINEQGWNILGIINTHSNADHIGGNRIIQERTNCKIYAYDIEKSFTEYPILETSFLYGAYPFKDIKNKFLFAKGSNVDLIQDNLPEGLEYFLLKGHFFDMIGIKTSDNVYFLADSLFSEDIITKYHIFFIYDIKEFLNTLNYLETLKGNFYVPSHASITNDILNLIKLNKNKVSEIMNIIYNYCEEERTTEEIMQYVFNKYNLNININQYILIGSTIKSYLSYLYDENKIYYSFKNNLLIWKKI